MSANYNHIILLVRRCTFQSWIRLNLKSLERSKRSRRVWFVMNAGKAARLLIILYLLGYIVIAVPLGVLLAGLELGWW